MLTVPPQNSWSSVYLSIIFFLVIQYCFFNPHFGLISSVGFYMQVPRFPRTRNASAIGWDKLASTWPAVLDDQI